MAASLDDALSPDFTDTAAIAIFLRDARANGEASSLNAAAVNVLQQKLDRLARHQDAERAAHVWPERKPDRRHSIVEDLARVRRRSIFEALARPEAGQPPIRLAELFPSYYQPPLDGDGSDGDPNSPPTRLALAKGAGGLGENSSEHRRHAVFRTISVPEFTGDARREWNWSQQAAGDSDESPVSARAAAAEALRAERTVAAVIDHRSIYLLGEAGAGVPARAAHSGRNARPQQHTGQQGHAAEPAARDSRQQQQQQRVQQQEQVGQRGPSQPHRAEGTFLGNLDEWLSAAPAPEQPEPRQSPAAESPSGRWAPSLATVESIDGCGEMSPRASAGRVSTGADGVANSATGTPDVGGTEAYAPSRAAGEPNADSATGVRGDAVPAPPARDSPRQTGKRQIGGKFPSLVVSGMDSEQDSGADRSDRAGSAGEFEGIPIAGSPVRLVKTTSIIAAISSAAAGSESPHRPSRPGAATSIIGAPAAEGSPKRRPTDGSNISTGTENTVNRELPKLRSGGAAAGLKISRSMIDLHRSAGRSGGISPPSPHHGLRPSLSTDALAPPDDARAKLSQLLGAPLAIVPKSAIEPRSSRSASSSVGSKSSSKLRRAVSVGLEGETPKSVRLYATEASPHYPHPGAEGLDVLPFVEAVPWRPTMAAPPPSPVLPPTDQQWRFGQDDDAPTDDGAAAVRTMHHTDPEEMHTASDENMSVESMSVDSDPDGAPPPPPIEEPPPPTVSASRRTPTSKWLDAMFESARTGRRKSLGLPPSLKQSYARGSELRPVLRKSASTPALSSIGHSSGSLHRMGGLESDHDRESAARHADECEENDGSRADRHGGQNGGHKVTRTTSENGVHARYNRPRSTESYRRSYLDD